MIKDKGIERMQAVFRDAAIFSFGCAVSTPETDRKLMLFAAFIATGFAVVIGLVRLWGSDE